MKTMHATSLFALVTSLFFLVQQEANAEPPKDLPLSRFEYRSVAMGSNLDFILYAENENTAVQAIANALDTLESKSRSINNYDPKSEVRSMQGLEKGKPFPLPKELADCLRESRKWFELSDGAFDVTQSKLFRLWSAARKNGINPSEAEIAGTQQRSTWSDITISSHDEDGIRNGTATATLLHTGPELSLDVGGVAVGYLIDQMMVSLKASGVRRAMIDAGGDIIVSEAPPGRDGWTVDVAGINPDSPPIYRLSLENCAVTTSGDLNQFAVIGDVRYSHIVDPRVQRPVMQRRSVTVVAKSGVDADAGATALAALGPQDAFQLIGDMPLLEVIYMSLGQEGPDEVLASENRKSPQVGGGTSVPYLQYWSRN